jgi:hypothetical protein
MFAVALSLGMNSNMKNNEGALFAAFGALQF